MKSFPHWRDGRVVDYNGLENRRTERYRGFESLSLRKQGCKSASYVIYTLYYTPKLLGISCMVYCGTMSGILFLRIIQSY